MFYLEDWGYDTWLKTAKPNHTPFIRDIFKIQGYRKVESKGLKKIIWKSLHIFRFAILIWKDKVDFNVKCITGNKHFLKINSSTQRMM